MDELTVVGAEDGALVVVSAAGDRYRIPITESLHAALRRHRPAGASGHRVGPKDIQTAIRAGQSSAEVAAATGEPLDYIERFEGPVLAEREYVIAAARRITVAVAAEGETGALQTFGTVLDERLGELAARDVRWTTAKRSGQWTVSVSFVDDDVAREAQWSFDPKKGSLAPTNHEAQTLSQQGDAPASVMPRLRAVPVEERSAGSRFDSGAFEVDDTDAPGLSRIPRDTPSSDGLSQSEQGRGMGQTADLLEALRKRRGEREWAPDEDRESARAAHPSTGSIRIVDVPLDPPPDEPQHGPPEAATDGILPSPDDHPDEQDAPAPPATKPPSRRGRAAMPSWDDIVFGARPDDDPA